MSLPDAYGDSTPSAIVFIHGLGGDLFDTWVGPDTSRKDCWLHWVGQDTGCDVWTLGYDSALSGWQDQAMPLPDQGTQIVQLLAVHPGLRDRKIVLVGHSMGGLVIKTIIIQSQTAGDSRARALVGRLCGVVFIATPHQGSQLASLAMAVAIVLRTNAQVGDMTRHDAHLRQLGTAFRELRRTLNLKVAAFAEGRDVVRKERGWIGLVARQVGVRVVDPSSSDLGLEGVTTVPLAEDHFSICKPSSRDAQIHHALVAFIREEILAEPPAIGSTDCEAQSKLETTFDRVAASSGDHEPADKVFQSLKQDASRGSPLTSVPVVVPTEGHGTKGDAALSTAPMSIGPFTASVSTSRGVATSPAGSSVGVSVVSQPRTVGPSPVAAQQTEYVYVAPSGDKPSFSLFGAVALLALTAILGIWASERSPGDPIRPPNGPAPEEYVSQNSALEFGVASTREEADVMLKKLADLGIAATILPPPGPGAYPLHILSDVSVQDPIELDRQAKSAQSAGFTGVKRLR